LVAVLDVIEVAILDPVGFLDRFVARVELLHELLAIRRIELVGFDVQPQPEEQLAIEESEHARAVVHHLRRSSR
jgi:hypothetical protein